jgi:uncharacterized membrane protein
MLAMITATNGGMTFNLMLSLVFALSIIGSYGLLFNLLNAYWQTTDEGRQATSALRALWSALGAFFAPLFLVILSNVEGFLELLHAYGIGWTGAPGDVNF